MNLTREQLIAKFGNCSESFLRANSDGGAPCSAVVEQDACDEPLGKTSGTAMTAKPSTDIAKLNKTERAYYDYVRSNPNTDWIGVQNMTFKLADDTRFTPDFNVLCGQWMQCVDVKGFQREDALIKIKVAARMFPWATFVIVKKTKDGWEHTSVKP